MRTRRVAAPGLSLGTAGLALGLASGPAAAHGGTTAPGGVSVALVLGATVLAGLLAGMAGLALPPVPRLAGARPVVFGTVLVALGGSLLASAAASGRPALLVGVLVGGAVTGLTARADGLCSCRADVLTGAVFAHRLVEGLLLGVLLGTGGSVAAVGGALVAGHAAVELAVLGRSYRSADALARGAGALVAVTAGFVGATAAGVAVVPAVPAVVEVVVLAAAGCVLLVAGLSEYRGVAPAA
jgi:hypothetical protein